MSDMLITENELKIIKKIVEIYDDVKTMERLLAGIDDDHVKKITIEKNRNISYLKRELITLFQTNKS